jgi:uncharacterized phage-like protein YoqJ
MIKKLLVSGYKAHELGIFSPKHEGIPYIKEAIKRRLISLIEEGLEWVIIGGQLGIEIWAGETVVELKKEYPQLKLMIITPFLGQEEKWNEANQEVYQRLVSNADCVNSASKESYQGPWQFRNRTQFVLRKTDGFLVLYDDEKEGSPKYLLRDALKEAEHRDYPIFKIDSYDLQAIVEEKMYDWL